MCAAFFYCLSHSCVHTHCTVCYFEWILLNEKIISSLTSHSAKKMCSVWRTQHTHTHLYPVLFVFSTFCILFVALETQSHIHSEFSVLLQIKSVLSAQFSRVAELLQSLCKICNNSVFLMIIAYLYICFCKQLTTAFSVKQCHFCMHRWFFFFSSSSFVFPPTPHAI